MEPPCCICGADGRGLTATRSGYRIIRCTECKLIYASPLPSEAELTAFYQGFKYSLLADAEFDAQVARAKRGIADITKVVRKIAGRDVRTVLDYGAGLGFFANALADFYPDVSMFDLDGDARRLAADSFPGRFKIFHEPDKALAGKLDLILLNQVIEHIPDPRDLLVRLRSALNPGGVMVITTPNNDTDDMLIRPDVFYHYVNMSASTRGRAAQKLVSDSWLCCDPPRHLYSFNAGNLALLAGQAGLRELVTDTFYFDDDPLGQPKYQIGRSLSVKSMAKTALFALSKVAGPAARLVDRKKVRGTTLMSCFTLAPGGACTDRELP